MKTFKIVLSICFVVILIASCINIFRTGDMHARRGYWLYSKRKYIEAEIEFKKAIQKGLKKEKTELVYTNLGNVYVELKKYKQSIQMHKKALKLNPKYHEAWVNLAIAYRFSRDFKNAEKCYKQALVLKPDYAELHSSLGVYYIITHKYKNAVMHLEKAVKLDVKLATAWSNLAFAYALVGRFDDADDTLKKAVVLGYENGPIIHKKINDLRMLAGKPRR